MSINRLFNVLVTVALIAVVMFTLWESIETTKVVSAQSENMVSDSPCFSGADRLALTAVYTDESRAWVPITQKGPAGVDGGLIELLSNYRTCSK